MILLFACGNNSVLNEIDDVVGAYRVFIFYDENGVQHDEKTLGIKEHLYLSIMENGEVRFDFYDFPQKTVDSTTGTICAESELNDLKSAGIDPMDWDSADRYYEVRLGDESNCYIACWVNSGAVEVFYSDCQYSFFPETHVLFDVLEIDNTLAQRFIIHAPDRSNGHNRQRIQLVWNFLGEVNLPNDEQGVER